MVLTDNPAWSNSPLAYPSFHKLILSVTEAKRSEETIGAEPREGGGSDFYFTLQEATE